MVVRVSQARHDVHRALNRRPPVPTGETVHVPRGSVQEPFMKLLRVRKPEESYKLSRQTVLVLHLRNPSTIVMVVEDNKLHPLAEDRLQYKPKSRANRKQTRSARDSHPKDPAIQALHGLLDRFKPPVEPVVRAAHHDDERTAVWFRQRYPLGQVKSRAGRSPAASRNKCGSTLTGASAALARA
jgi:hypothetical protein